MTTASLLTGRLYGVNEGPWSLRSPASFTPNALPLGVAALLIHANLAPLYLIARDKRLDAMNALAPCKALSKDAKHNAPAARSTCTAFEVNLCQPLPRARDVNSVKF